MCRCADERFECNRRIVLSFVQQTKQVALILLQVVWCWMLTMMQQVISVDELLAHELFKVGATNQARGTRHFQACVA
jgi:hypothetical protein